MRRAALLTLLVVSFKATGTVPAPGPGGSAH